MTQPNSELLNSLNVGLIRLDTKMDSVLGSLKDMKEQHQDHETRIRVLESIARVSPADFQMLKDSAVTASTMWKIAGALFTLAGLLFTGINMIIK